MNAALLKPHIQTPANAWMGPAVVLCFVLVTGLALVTGAAAPNDGSVQVHASVDGIGVFPLSEQTWRSRVICHPDKTTEAPRVWIGEEFFAFEYGESCDFSRRDFVADYGYCGNGEYRLEDGKLMFKTGRKGFFFGFGGLPGELQRPGNRFGVCWGPHLKDRYRLRLVLTQDVPRTDWTFSLVETRRKRPQKHFVVEGAGRQAFEIDLGFVRNLQPRLPILGIQFECSTPNAAIAIESISIAPSSANVYFRKRFTLAAKPVLAHATYQVSPVYDFYINGKKVDSGTRAYTSGPQKTVDLRPHLQVGENQIAFRSEFMYWNGGARPEWLFEGIAVDRAGGITRILGDRGWTCSYTADEGWTQSGFDDSDWKPPRTYEYSNYMDRVKTRVSWGFNPRHMGLLDVQLSGRPYPVFDHSEAPVFRVRLPAGLDRRFIPVVDVYEAGTNTRVETARCADRERGPSFYTFRAALATRTPGPYRLIWRLEDATGNTIETRREEMVIVGPIPQQRLPLAGFEQEFEKRLRRVAHFDCTAPLEKPEEFLDHSGMYRPAKVGPGRIVRESGLSYRETGGGSFDYFAYRLHLKDRGQPYLVEIVIPDDRERYTYSGVAELHPVRYGNNTNRRGLFSATGSCRTGGRYPLTGGVRRIRYIYHPGSETAAVVVMNGRRDSRAAACEVNIYRVDGGLPALDVPVSDRLFGTHNERLSVAAATLACENPMENDRRLQVNGHRDAWYHWYRIFERKIRLLRHQGRNLTVEGLLMYTKTEFPSLVNSYGASNQEFDPAFLALKMYEHNGIRCLIGFEYMSNQAMEIANVDTTSDRRMWQGEPTLQKVDRHGRQLASMSHAGGNFLHPVVEEYFMSVLQEIRDRYHFSQAVAGMLMVVNNWYAPGFGMCGFLDLMPGEIGYGDYTVGLFGQETGIRLAVDPTAPDRFVQRYELLTGEHREAWFAWRTRKVHEFVKRMSGRLRSGENPWQLNIYPTFKHQQLDPMPAFGDPAANRQKCRGALTQFLRDSAFPLDLYRDDPHIRLVAPLVTVGFKGRVAGERVLNHHAWNTNPGTIDGVRRLGAFFMNTALDEVDCPATQVDAWPWTGTRRGVFVARGVEDNVMNDFVNVLARVTPRLVISQWMDCNMETASGPQLRRFARELYVTPAAEFAPLPATRVRGVAAQVASRPGGGLYLRLVNNSPHISTGIIRPGGAALRDLVYDRVPTARKPGIFVVKMLPNDIRTFEATDGQPEAVDCKMSFADKTVAELKQRADEILGKPWLMAGVPEDKAAALKRARGAGDAFTIHTLLDDPEVFGCVERNQREHALRDNQQRLLDDLKKTGAARINFAGLREYTDPDGNRWLPDQRYLISGAYGNTGAKYADRGDLPIADTVADRVYQTEAYGRHLTYRIPLPSGTYRIGLCIAEAYHKIDRAGMRRFKVRIQGHTWPDRLDPFARASGFAKAVILPPENAVVADGMLTLEFTGGVGVQGVVIEKRPGEANDKH